MRAFLSEEKQVSLIKDNKQIYHKEAILFFFVKLPTSNLNLEK